MIPEMERMIAELRDYGVMTSVLGPEKARAAADKLEALLKDYSDLLSQHSLLSLEFHRAVSLDTSFGDTDCSDRYYFGDS
jgi:hypothetical protein